MPLVTPEIALAFALLAVAALYSSVGHGGASGYLAVLALAGLAPEELRPTALALNILVSLIAAARFAWAGHFRWQLLWPFLVTSVPCAFIAGRWIRLEDPIYKWLLGLVLLYAAWRMMSAKLGKAAEVARRAGLPVALAFGAGIGLLSGVIGVGGGIFLSPLILLMGWAEPRPTAAISAVFIMVNSAAALGGVVMQHEALPLQAGPLMLHGAAVVIGGAIGASLGAGRFDPVLLRRLLGVVLIVAGAKMFLP